MASKQVKYNIPPDLMDLALAVRKSKDPHGTFRRMGLSMNVDLVEAVIAAGFKGVDEFVYVCQNAEIQKEEPINDEGETARIVTGVMAILFVVAFIWLVFS